MGLVRILQQYTDIKHFGLQKETFLYGAIILEYGNLENNTYKNARHDPHACPRSALIVEY